MFGHIQTAACDGEEREMQRAIAMIGKQNMAEVVAQHFAYRIEHTEPIQSKRLNNKQQAHTGSSTTDVSL